MRYRPIWVICLLFLLLSSFGIVARAQQGDAKPKAVVPETVKDVGPINRGQQVTHEFVLRNEGTAPLQITEVKPSCGCTVAEYDATIAPGASGKVRASIDTTNFKGAIAKAVRVYTNDPANPQVNLVLKASIQTRVEVDPGYARFVAVFGEAQRTSVQTIWSEEKPDLEVLKAESPYPFVKVKFRQAPEAAEGEEGKAEDAAGRWLVEVDLDRQAPVGPIADFIVVTTDHPEMKTVRIPVSGFVRPVLSVTPRLADFGRRELNEPQTATLEVRNLSSGRVKLGEIATDLEGLRAEIEPVEEGRLYKVLLTLEPGMPKGEFAGLVTITTTSSKQPQIEVSVKGVVL